MTRQLTVRSVALAIQVGLLVWSGCNKSAEPAGGGEPSEPVKAPLEERFGKLQKRADIPVPTGQPSRGFSLSPDRKTAAFGGSDGSITLTPVEGGETRTLIGHKEAVFEVAHTPDGQRLVSGGADNRLVVWDLAEGTPIHDVKAHNGDVKALAVSSDGTLIATGSVDDDVRVWRMKDGKRAHHFQGHTSTVYTVAFSPDGQSLYSGARDAHVRRWNLEKGEGDGEPIRLDNTVIALRWSPDHKVLYAAGLTGQLAWIEPREMKVLHERRLPVSARVTDLAVSPSGNLATSTLDGKVTVWSPDPKQAEPLAGPIDAHEGEILQLRFAGETIVTLGQDGKLGRWETTTGKPIGPPRALPPVNGVVRAVALRDGADDAAVASDGHVFVVDAKAAGEKPQKPVLGPGSVSSLLYDEKGDRLLVGRDNGHIVELGVSAGYEKTGDHAVHGGSVRHLALAPDGAIWSAGDDIAIFKLDPKTFEPQITITDHTSPLRALAVDPTGKRLASVEEDNITIIRYVESGTVQWTRRGHLISHLAFDPDGKILAMVENRVVIMLYDVEERREVKKLKGNPTRIAALAYHPSGEALITLDDLGGVRVWSIADGSMLSAGNAGRGKPRALALSKDGSTILTGGMDPQGSAKLFELTGK